MNLKDFLDNQTELRTQLLKLIIKRELSVNSASAQMGIAYTTLTGFLKKNKNIGLIQLSKVSNFIEKNK